MTRTKHKRIKEKKNREREHKDVNENENLLVYDPTDPLALLELQNQPHYLLELHKIGQSFDL